MNQQSTKPNQPNTKPRPNQPGTSPRQKRTTSNTGIKSFASTDTGRQRKLNEDYYMDLTRWEREGHPPLPQAAQKGRLWIVTDGMGGHAGGQQASKMAAEHALALYYQDDSPDPRQSLPHAIRQANAAVYNYAQQNPDLKGMGTTLVAAALQNGLLHVAWVGDSRAYRLRQGQIQRLTEDHSWVQQAMKQGTITPEEAAAHPNRSIVLRSIGAKPEVRPELNTYQTQPGDIYLLCSDGLTGVVSDEEIRQTLLAGRSRQEAVQSLIEQANALGGPDNITAAVVTLGAYPDKGAVAKSSAPILLIGAIVGLLLGVILLFLWKPFSPAAKSDVAYGALTLATNTTPDAAVVVGAAETGEAPSAGSTIEISNQTPTVEASPTSSSTVTSPTPSPTTVISPSQITPAPSPPGIAQSASTKIPKPELIAPAPQEEEDTTYSTETPTQFVWKWPGQLADNQGFEIFVWLDGAAPQGTYDARELMKEPTFENRGNGEYAFSLNLTGSPGVTQTSPDYLWSVAVVQLEPYMVLVQSEPRTINIAFPGAPGEPGGGGSGGGDPISPPKDLPKK